jgi:hypothetical protein
LRWLLCAIKMIPAPPMGHDTQLLCYPRMSGRPGDLLLKALFALAVDTGDSFSPEKQPHLSKTERKPCAILRPPDSFFHERRHEARDHHRGSRPGK